MTMKRQNIQTTLMESLNSLSLLESKLTNKEIKPESFELSSMS